MDQFLEFGMPKSSKAYCNIGVMCGVPLLISVVEFGEERVIDFFVFTSHDLRALIVLTKWPTINQEVGIYSAVLQVVW